MLSLIAGWVSGYFESRWCENRWTDTCSSPTVCSGCTPHVDLEGRTAVPHLIFLVCSCLFPVVGVPVFIPANTMQCSHFCSFLWHLLCCYCFVTVTLKSYGQYLVVALCFPNKYRCWNIFTMTCLLSLEKCTFKSFAYLKVFCLCSPLMILVWGLKLKSLFCFELIFV